MSYDDNCLINIPSSSGPYAKILICSKSFLVTPGFNLSKLLNKNYKIISISLKKPKK